MSLKEKFKNFFNTDDEYEYIEEVEKGEPDNSHLKQKSNQNVVSLSAIQQPSSKVILCEPKSYNEVQEIADNLLNKRAVVINLQRVDHTQAKRIVDFLSGTVYAIKGDIQKLGLATFLCTPDNVDVSGTITQTIIDEAELEKGW
ncbi:cell division protein SepF [Pseudogracilibacillus auburnensis]|uniref:cell division protein SepF n=1 Tax=Pseudogracilibacillus auburnensis TaxID=1494959 RepID=UPI001A957909|nr:cell division protein SepF [Pseudogracilibacillus auburnensis]MBO1005525.1 cell division protein SepF [Pseudogracilibacillus auburnensis]